MAQRSTRELTPEETAHVTDVLRRLREHFHEWQYPSHEHDLVGFAFYEGCGGTEHCGAILAEAAPFALGSELVARHGFQWVMVGSGDRWCYAVVHPTWTEPIELHSLEDGSWNDEEYTSLPSPGRVTHESLDTIIERVGQLASGTWTRGLRR